MLPVSLLKQHLLNEKHWVREAVMGYFYESWTTDEEIATLVLQGHERYFHIGLFPLLYPLDRLPIEEFSAQMVLDLLERTPCEIAVVQLNRCLEVLPLGFLRRKETWLKKQPRVEEATRRQIQLRRELAARTDAELWEEFLEFSGRKSLRRVPHRFDRGRADGLVETLAARKSPDRETICRALRSPEFAETWFEALLVKLAGARRLREAVPCIVDKIRDDADFRPDFTLGALARIGDPAIVGLIRELLPRMPESFRVTAAEVLGLIKSRESEALLLSLLEEEKRPDVRYWMADALCGLFSDFGIEPVRRFIQRGHGLNYPPLEEKLLPVIDILNLRIPEAEAWRARMEEKAARPAAPSRERVQGLQATMIEALEELDREQEAREQEFVKFCGPPEPSGEIGLCPCGSGELYRDCCGKRRR